MAQVSLYPRFTNFPKILFAISTYNRPVVTQFALASLQNARTQDARLVIYGDSSTAHDETFVQSHADEIVRFHRNSGIERSRARAMRDPIHRFTDFDLLYLTEMVDRIVWKLDRAPKLETMYGWDYHWPALLKCPFLQTNIPYLEHFVRNRHEAGLHSKCSGNTEAAKVDFNRDRALNPTQRWILIAPTFRE